jgi:hypothetical protein
MIANFAHATEPYTPPKGSLERKAILNALSDMIQSSKLEAVFVVKCLRVKNGWAWIETDPQSPDGKNQYEPIDALLHKEEGQWKVKEVRPCCGDCADDPDCFDIKRYYKKLIRKFPSAPRDIFSKQSR